jgi:hypothetical protein
MSFLVKGGRLTYDNAVASFVLLQFGVDPHAIQREPDL